MFGDRSFYPLVVDRALPFADLRDPRSRANEIAAHRVEFRMKADELRAAPAAFRADHDDERAGPNARL